MRIIPALSLKREKKSSVIQAQVLLRVTSLLASALPLIGSSITPMSNTKSLRV